MAKDNKGGMSKKSVSADKGQKASTKIDNDSWPSFGNKKGVLKNEYDTKYGKHVTSAGKSRVKKAGVKKG